MSLIKENLTKINIYSANNKLIILYFQSKLNKERKITVKENETMRVTLERKPNWVALTF